MYYQNYEEYMKKVLGYETNPRNIYENIWVDYKTNQNDKRLEEYYPKIYKIINELIDGENIGNIKNIENKDIDCIVEKIYKKLEMNINNQTNKENLYIRNNTINGVNRQYQVNSQLSKDILKILIINKLLDMKKEEKIYKKDGTKIKDFNFPKEILNGNNYNKFYNY